MELVVDICFGSGVKCENDNHNECSEYSTGSESITKRQKLITHKDIMKIQWGADGEENNSAQGQTKYT